MTDLREAIKAAYLAGATDVHNHWVEKHPLEMRGDPEFGESASDYADSVAIPDAEALVEALEFIAREGGQAESRIAADALANYRKG